MDVAGTKSARAEGRVSRNSVRKMSVGRRQKKQIRPTTWRAHETNQRGASSRGLGGWLFLEQSNSSPRIQRIQWGRGQIPLRSIEDDVAITKSFVAAPTGPTVLVGPSDGGIVVSGAGN